MIDAKELRIGNIAHSMDPIYKISMEDVTLPVVTIICKYDFLNTIHLQGIPLTEEWLIKLGFKKSASQNPFAVNFYIDNFGVSRHFRDGNYYSLTAIIKYVHDLQNLYFAITRKELELKQTT